MIFYKRIQHFNYTIRLESIFATMTSESLLSINEFKVCKFYEKDDYLFHEGNDPKGIDPCSPSPPKNESDPAYS